MRVSKRILTTAIGAVAVMAMTTAPALAATAATKPIDVVQKIIKGQTGTNAGRATAKETVGNLSVTVGRDKAGVALESYAQRKDANSVRMMAVIRDKSQSAVNFKLGVPAGAKVKILPNGAAVILPAKGVAVATIGKPWATDANNKHLPTSYAYKAGVLTQRVNTNGAAFPVVADPWITLGTKVYVHLNPADQRALITGGALGAAAVGAAVCIELGPGDVICAVGAAVVGGLMASYISDYYHPRCTVVIAFNYWGGIAGRSTEHCT